MRRRDAQAMANHLKYLSNAFPVTIIYIGVGVAARGLLREGMTTSEALFAQFGRRTTPLSLPPFLVETDAGRAQWRRLLLTIEQQTRPRGQVPRDAGRRAVRLPLHPQHRPLRLTDDPHRPRLPTRYPHPDRSDCRWS